MKTASLLLLAFFSITLFSCVDNTTKDNPTDPVDPIETPVEDSTKTTPTEPTEDPVSEEITYGIDISKYQGDEMELMAKSKDSLSFVICRATQGITYTDADFSKNWNEIQKKGFIRGAYHFYMSNDSPEKQAEHFLNQISDLKATDFPPIIDFENTSIAKGYNKEQIIEGLWKFIFIVEEKSGRRPIIYTNGNIGNEYLTASRFANYTLWIADYSSSEKPTLPGAWNGMDWEMWQKSDNYRFENIQNDFDVFNGNLADLKKMITESISK